MSKIESNYFFFILLLFIPFFHFLRPHLSNNFSNQFYIFFIPLIWPGVAHGSLDFLIAKRLGIVETLFKKIIFLFSYIFLAVCFTTFWINKPELCLTIFLLISIFHFGISDSLLKSKINFLEIFIRGSIPISFPIYYYGDQVGIIFTQLYIDNFFFEEIKIVINYLFYFVQICILYFIFFMIKNNEKEKNNIIPEIFLLYFCFTYFEPFIAFSIYFCFFHSLRHLHDEKKSKQSFIFQNYKKNNSFYFFSISNLNLFFPFCRYWSRKL